MANGNVKKYLNISCCKLLNKEEEDKNEMKTGKKKNTNKLITDSENIDDIKNHVLKTPNLNLNKNENMKNILNEEKNDIERIKEVMDKSK